ncbi:MAG: biotin transporter BioY [bacterium]|nr:biotin transporter BioY [bacterium]
MKTKDIVYIALFAAITASLSLFPPITMPIAGVPITAQSIAPMLAGSIIGSKRGFLSLLLFLIFIAIGLPVLSGGRGGLNIFFGANAGFILCWPVSAYIIGFLFEKFWKKLNYFNSFLFITFGGIIILYIAGILWISLIAKISIYKSFIGCLVFIPGDIIKAIIATFVSMLIKKSYPIIK